jgi:lysophospholipase L1-like esterase
MRMRWIISIVLSAFMVALLPLVAFAGPPSGGGKPGGSTSLKYTAVGDSIAFGNGATNNYGYVYIFRDFLATKGTADTGDDVSVELKNQSKQGMKSYDLLYQLQLDRATKNAVKSANVLTIVIGGNNLLECASDNYTVIDEVCAQAGVDQFNADWPEILKQIKKIKNLKDTDPIPGLYVMTLYNPYDINDPLFNTADNYIQQINTTIKGDTSYTVADVYTNFYNNNDKMCEWTHFCESTRDPHPTDEGHKQISLVHQGVYK